MRRRDDDLDDYLELETMRVWLQDRLPLHEQRNHDDNCSAVVRHAMRQAAENESAVVRKPFRVVNGRLAHR